MNQAAQPQADAVAMTGIAKSFGGVAALEHVDFTVKKGEIHALLGGNGAGKSTVLKMLSGVHKPDKGEIWINGVKLEEHTPEAARRAPEIATGSDFLSIGTNDLTQLVLGLDREQSKSAPVTDLRVLRLIDSTVRAAHAAGVVVDVCGESASDAVAMPILIGLGVDELSVAAARVGDVRQWIRGLDYSASRKNSERRLLDQAADAAGKSRRSCRNRPSCGRGELGHRCRSGDDHDGLEHCDHLDTVPELSCSKRLLY